MNQNDVNERWRKWKEVKPVLIYFKNEEIVINYENGISFNSPLTAGIHCLLNGEVGLTKLFSLNH